MSVRMIGLITGMVGMIVVPTMGQGISDAQNKLLSRRAAEADAYRKLAEAVYGVQLNSETFVRDFVAESDQIRTAVDAVVKGVRLGEARYYEDGTCEIDAEVTVAKLVTEIKRIHSEHYRGRTVTSTDIENIKKYVKTDVIRATGSGVPRPELPPNLPSGVDGIITQLPSDFPKPRYLPIPGIWKNLPAQGRLMAERAARVDAMRKLLEQIKGLRLTSETLVRDFVAESDEIRTQATGIVVGAYETGKYLHSDELIAEVTMAVPVEKVIERIKELHSTHYKGRIVTSTDIVNVKKQIQRDIIEATGSGVPPERFLAQVEAAAGYDAPPWFGTTLEAVGQASLDSSKPEAQGRLLAERAAKVDAVRNLLEHVQGLEIQSGTTVRDFVAEQDHVLTHLRGVLTGAVADDPEWGGAVVRVRVSIPAAEVWATVNDHLRMMLRHGS